MVGAGVVGAEVVGSGVAGDGVVGAGVVGAEVAGADAVGAGVVGAGVVEAGVVTAIGFVGAGLVGRSRRRRCRGGRSRCCRCRGGSREQTLQVLGWLQGAGVVGVEVVGAGVVGAEVVAAGFSKAEGVGAGAEGVEVLGAGIGPGQGSLIWSVGQGAVVWMPQQPVQVSSYGASVARSATWSAAGSAWSGGGVHSAVPVVSIPGRGLSRRFFVDLALRTDRSMQRKPGKRGTGRGEPATRGSVSFLLLLSFFILVFHVQPCARNRYLLLGALRESAAPEMLSSPLVMPRCPYAISCFHVAVT